MSSVVASRGVVDSYALSPIQQGMLFHHLEDAHSGVDIEQLVIEYREPPDVAALERAWQATLARHPVMRTAFRWDGLAHPVQDVHAAAMLRIERRDGELAAFLAEDRERGFDLKTPPLMRLTLVGTTLVWTLHHILMDGRAFIVVLDEVERRYRGEAIDGGGAAFRPYVDWIERLDLAGASEFWRRTLAGFTAPTPLPLEPDPLPKDAASHGEVEDRLPEPVTAALRAIAKQHDVTLNTIVMGAWAIVLARFSSEPEVVFGATKTTRRGSVADAESIVGLFLNTIPMRIAIDRGATVVEMLQRLRQAWIDVRQYEHAPLVQIKRASDVPASAPLFDSLVVFENQRFDTALAALGPAWRDRGFRWFERTNFGLTLLAYGDPAMTLKLEYDAARFSRTTAQRILAHVIQTFTSIAADPLVQIGALDILPAAERERVLVGWNRTEFPYPRDTPLAKLVEAQVQRTPDATAVIFGDAQLTYRELDTQANQLAHELVKHGAGPDKLVGICVERSLEMMVALLAVAKSGAGYLPMDPYLPPARLQHMIEDSALSVVITQRELRGELPAAAAAILLDDPAWRANSTGPLDARVRPEHVGYLLYTSGSTGKPKGVQVPYGALVNLLWSIRDWLQFTGTDRLLAVTTISFDIAGADIWMPWLVGATTVLASREAAADGAQLRALIDRHDVTFLQATPVTWWLLLGAGWTGKRDLQIVCTGEAMPRELAGKLVPIVRRVWNLYGPTETTIWSTGYLVSDGTAPILIGRPVGNTQCYVLDEQRRPVPLGAIGELYIAGDGVARGYLNRPELTAERFLDDPFRPGARMYRTGDLVRYLPDGNLECLGRTDHQVKIRGFRIELGEIETVLKQHPAIAQAVVVAREDTPGDKRLVAYVVASGSAPDRGELRTLLKASLPDYMVPADFVALDRLPISPNGKIDRKALPAPQRTEEPTAAGGFVAPRTDTERKLVDIFARAIGTAKVGIHDDFFDLGGHSLAAMRAIALIKSELGVELSVRIMFQAHTVAQIAELIAKRAGNGHAADDWSTCIRIRPTGANPPLWCIARPNVNALGYVFLSRHLGPAQPVYGLQRKLDEDPDLDFTPEQIRDTAAEYIREMRAIQPHGPYHFAGQCQGAYIAFEMTRQLEAAGETVALLAMLDVWPDENTRYKTVFLAYEYARKLRKRLLPKRTAPAEQPPPAPAGITPPPRSTGAANRLRDRYWPGPAWKPDTVRAKIVVFRVPSQAIYRIRDKAMGWRDRTRGPVVVEDIPGDHMTFLREPYVRVLAHKIAQHIEAAPAPMHELPASAASEPPAG